MKPQNIGLDKHNNVKIYDFGMAKELHDDMKDVKSSRKHKYDTYIATQCVGSPRYMAPEVNIGFKYGFRADIYSFSLVLWELMSLKFCFDDITNIIDFASNVYEKKVRPDIKKDWPKELKRLLRQGWHHDPLNRPEAAEYCDELQICMRQRMLNIYTNL
jgi:serine/threonine protein kinase